MPLGRCLVIGCGTSGGKQFRFPRTVRALEWKKFCQNPKLDSVHYTKLHDRFHICPKHFEEKCYTYPTSGKLLRNALPTLFPPSLPKEAHLESVLEVDQFSPRSPSPEYCVIVWLTYYEWVYDIINGEADQDRIVFQCPCKDDKNGFLMIRDRGWDGENINTLHLVALPYRPGLLTIRDLRASHLPLLRNIYTIGKEVVEEKYGIPGSQLRIFLQYLPSFYHLNVHFTMVDEEIYGMVGKIRRYNSRLMI
ncbi:hypothetical protein J437_LFUL016194 [Ladona fulva]|uniref:THAP-type domain-containing protein n=1 Tax=Ladona fulva TaxID=123851 RepID=A0A8K0P795_LADFU|nr:hypothetical protein J437_LFUL016194 [Ladona fulva]